MKIDKQIKEKIIEYLLNTWEIFPLYQFYELKIPFIDINIAIYSILAVPDIKIKLDFVSKFFNIYGIYLRASQCIGSVFIWEKFTNARISAHSLSACTSLATKKYVEDAYLAQEYSNNFLNLISYGLEAEVITDLPKVLQVFLKETK